MLQIKFKVVNQRISREDRIVPVADSKNYLQAHFDFLTPEWEGQIITALFTKDDNTYHMLLDENNECLVPWEVISKGNLYVSCFTGNLITVNKSRVYIKESGYVADPQSSVTPTPSIYTQILTRIDELETTMYNELKNIDGGLFTDWEETGGE